MDKNSLPGWTTKIDEISNGVFKVTLTDKFGRKAEVIDDATDETIEKTLGYAFNIEKQISSNWTKFLFDFCLLQLTANSTIQQLYNENNFGSWYIELGNKRLLYLGKESWLVSQTKTDSKWFDNYIIKDDELTYDTVMLFLKQMK